MKKTTWRQFGYLEGIRKARNIARQESKVAKLIKKETCIDENTIPEPTTEDYVKAEARQRQSVWLKIVLEKYHKKECERLFAKNDELRKMYPKYTSKVHNGNLGDV